MSILASCALFPSDPAGGFVSKLGPDGSPSVIFPNCQSRPLELLSIEVFTYVEGEVGEKKKVWGIYSETPRPVEDLYLLGETPDGFTANGAWNRSLESEKIFIQANFAGGVQLTNTANYSQYQSGLWYIEGRVSTESALRDQIYCNPAT